MKNTLKYLRSISDKITIELKAEQFSYKVMVYLEGTIIFQAEEKTWRKLKGVLESRDLADRIYYQIHWDDMMRDKGFNELLKSLYK